MTSGPKLELDRQVLDLSMKHLGPCCRIDESHARVIIGDILLCGEGIGEKRLVIER